MMMLWFWVILILMIIVASSFVVWPFIRKHTQLLPSHDEHSAKLYMNQLLILENELENKVITVEIYQQLKAEIERGVLQDIENFSKKSQYVSVKPNLSTAFILVIFIAALSLFLYFKWGASIQLKQYYFSRAHAMLVETAIKNFDTPEKLINKMKSVLQQHPNSAEGWYLLGRLYCGTNNFSQGLQAFTKAVQLNPNNLTYKLQYAQADFFANHQTLSKNAATYLTEVITKEPKNLTAVNLIALNAFTHKDYQVAIDRWESLLKYFPATTADGQVIMNAIVEAQKRLK